MWPVCWLSMTIQQITVKLSSYESEIWEGLCCAAQACNFSYRQGVAGTGTVEGLEQWRIG